jgi:hypothetical protein
VEQAESDMTSTSIRTLLSKNNVSLREIGEYIGTSGEAVRQRLAVEEVDAVTAGAIVRAMVAICAQRFDSARQACDRLEVEAAAGVRRRRV